MNIEIQNRYQKQNVVERVILFAKIFDISIDDYKYDEDSEGKIFLYENNLMVGYIDTSKETLYSYNIFFETKLGRLSANFNTWQNVMNFLLPVTDYGIDFMEGIYYVDANTSGSYDTSVRLALRKDGLTTLDLDCNYNSSYLRIKNNIGEEINYTRAPLNDIVITHYDLANGFLPMCCVSQNHKLRFEFDTCFKNALYIQENENEISHFDEPEVLNRINFWQINREISKYDPTFLDVIRKTRKALTFDNIKMYENIIENCFHKYKTSIIKGLSSITINNKDFQNKELARVREKSNE